MQGLQWVAGVDEAGRGPLAGPVVAAAVILDRADMITGLADSKALSARRRERLAALIREKALAWSIGRADHREIDKLNILNASLLAMQRAILGLRIRPDRVLVDGNRCPDTDYPARAVVKGDRTEACISAASILAKVFPGPGNGGNGSKISGLWFRPAQGVSDQAAHPGVIRKRALPNSPAQFQPGTEVTGDRINSVP